MSAKRFLTWLSFNFHGNMETVTTCPLILLFPNKLIKHFRTVTPKVCDLI